MRRGAFTMIELIFVIVILGILAAVALPKFVGVTEQAREEKLKAFVTTLNRSVAPMLWSKHLAEGGSVKSETSIKKYIDVPIEIKNRDFSLAGCGDGTFAFIAEENATIISSGTEKLTYDINCRDGNATNPPAFQLVRGVYNGSGYDDTVIAGPEN